VLERLVRSEHKYKRGEVAAVVIAPTRELATQIHEVFNLFLATFTPREPTPIEGEEAPPPPPPEYPLACLVTGGTAAPYDTFFGQGSNILVGTPGRLASFLLSPRGMAAVRVGNLDVLVLDEADRLLSAPDHRRDVERIMRHLPKQRRTHLFSATMTDAVEDLVGVGLRNPVRIVVNLKDKRTGESATERRVPMGLANTFLVCGLADKTLQLLRVLQREAKVHEAAKFIVYFSTGAAVDYFYRVRPASPLSRS
jgi:ATP-dependent RNA helicase DDX55/SPB4